MPIRPMQPPRRSALLLVAVLAAWRSRTAQGQDDAMVRAEPLTTLDEVNFGDRKDSTLSEKDIFSYKIGNGYKCALYGWTHTRHYAMGFLRNTDGSAFAKCSGLVPGANYDWKVYQFASNFKSSGPTNVLRVNREDQGLTSQDESKAASKSGASTADSSGQMIFEFRKGQKQVHLSGLALAKRGRSCFKWNTTGWHKGTYQRRFASSQAPDGKDWTWQQCASRCAEELDCDFWTLQLMVGGRCAMMVGEQGEYHDEGGHAEGGKVSGCSAFAALHSDFSSLRSQVSGSNSDILRLNNHIASSSKLIDKNAEEIKKLGQTKSDLVIQVKLLMNAKSKVEQALVSMTTLKDDTLKNLKLSQEDALDKVKQLNQKTAELANKTLEIESREVQLKAAFAVKSQLAVKTRVLTKIMARLDTANQELQELTAKKKELEAQLHSKTVEAQNITDHLSEVRAEKNELLNEYSDPSVKHFLERKAWKVYETPGVFHTVNKTWRYVLPSLKMRYEQGQGYLNFSQQRVHDKLNAFVGGKTTEPYLPMVSGILVYGIAIVPFFCAVSILTRAVCSWREILIFCHIWFMLTCLFATLFAMISGAEPLAVLAMHDASVYLFSQVLVGFMLLIYAVCMLLAWFVCSAGGTIEPLCRLIGTTILVPPLLVYCIFIWTPTMQDRLPEMDKLVLMTLESLGAKWIGAGMWIPYMLGTIVFAVEGVLELLCDKASRKKRKIDYIESKLQVRDLQELAALVPGKRLRLEDDVDDEEKIS